MLGATVVIVFTASFSSSPPFSHPFRSSVCVPCFVHHSRVLYGSSWVNNTSHEAGTPTWTPTRRMNRSRSSDTKCRGILRRIYARVAQRVWGIQLIYMVILVDTGDKLVLDDRAVFIPILSILLRAPVRRR